MTSSTDNLLNTDNLQIPDSQVVVVYTEWNASIVDELRNGVRAILGRFPGVKITEIAVPGCIEIPFVINQHAQNRKADAYIALGCVIRGETPHFDYVCQSVTQGITTLNTSITTPVVFGILTVDDHQQALDRLGGAHGHKGQEAAVTALKMIHIYHNFLKS